MMKGMIFYPLSDAIQALVLSGEALKWSEGKTKKAIHDVLKSYGIRIPTDPADSLDSLITFLKNCDSDDDDLFGDAPEEKPEDEPEEAMGEPDKPEEPKEPEKPEKPKAKKPTKVTSTPEQDQGKKGFRKYFSLSSLLRQNKSTLMPDEARNKLTDLGILEEKSYQDDRGKTRYYRCLTDKGLKYGVNIPKEGKQSARFYSDNFPELLEKIGGVRK